MNEDRKYAKQAHYLLEINNERLNAYRHAAKEVTDPQIHPILEEYADQAMQFADEFIRFSIDEEPYDAGTRQDGNDSTWKSVEKAIDQNNKKEILLAIGRGEKDAIRSFRESLENEMPQDLQNTIIHQIDGMVQAEQRLEEQVRNL